MPDLLPLASAKRSNNERTGIHAWYPYYAGYSEGFVDAAFTLLRTAKGQVALDPWSGSGTTGLVAQKRGISFIGADINPVMSAVAASKSFEPVSRRSELNRLVAETRNELLVARSGKWAPGFASVGRFDHTIARQVLTLSRARYRTDLWKTNTALLEGARTCDAVASLCLLALLRTLRSHLVTPEVSNPTWVSVGPFYQLPGGRILAAEFENNVESMISDLESAFGHYGQQIVPRTELQADARLLPIKDNCIDAVIGSPPYCTRIDYPVLTRVELELLASRNEFETLRKDSMGGTIVRDSIGLQLETLGPKARSLLQAIRAHRSKASDAYYFRYYANYLLDASMMIREISRVLRPGSSALVVVQSSYYKEIVIDLGELYSEIGATEGLRPTCVQHERLRAQMSHSNGRSSRYVKDKVYYEDVIRLDKP